MENNMLTSYLLSKSIADSHNLEDKNGFIVQSIIVDKAIDNQPLSTVFKIVQAQNSPVSKAEDVESETITTVVEDSSSNLETRSNDEDGQTKENNSDNSNVNETKDKRVELAQESLEELSKEMIHVKEMIQKDVMSQVKSIETFIHDTTDMTVRNEKLKSFLTLNEIDLDSYKNILVVDKIDNIISDLKSKKFKENLSNIESSKSPSKAKVKRRVKALNPLLSEATLKKFKSIFKEQNICQQDHAKLLVNLIYPLENLVYEIKRETVIEAVSISTS